MIGGSHPLTCKGFVARDRAILSRSALVTYAYDRTDIELTSPEDFTVYKQASKEDIAVRTCQGCDQDEERTYREVYSECAGRVS